MLKFYLILFWLNLFTSIKCSCISNNSEPIFGENTPDDEYQIQICVQNTFENDRLCIRSIDDTGNYSPYLAVNQDYPNSFFTMRFKNDKGQTVTFQNVKNKLYLASLSNGFIYYSPTVDDYSSWLIDAPLGSIKSLINVANGYSLYNINGFTLQSFSDKSTSFDLITRIYNKGTYRTLKQIEMFKIYITSNTNNDDSEKWILECISYKTFYIKNAMFSEYLEVYDSYPDPYGDPVPAVGASRPSYANDTYKWAISENYITNFYYSVDLKDDEKYVSNLSDEFERHKKWILF